MLQLLTPIILPTLTLGSLVAQAQAEALEVRDLVISDDVRPETIPPAHAPEIRQIEAYDRMVYVADAAAIAAVDAHLARHLQPLGTPCCHIRVEGHPFTDLNGRPSLLVTRVIPTPFTAEAGYLFPSSLDAILAEAPDTKIDAMIVIADAVARRAGYEPEIDPAARTLRLANPDVVVTFQDVGGDRVAITALRHSDGALISAAEADSLDAIETQAILYTQRFRAET